MESISRHITSLVINSLGADIHTYRHLRTEAILRNQGRADLWPARTWFKNESQRFHHIVKLKASSIIPTVRYIIVIKHVYNYVVSNSDITATGAVLQMMNIDHCYYLNVTTSSDVILHLLQPHPQKPYNS